MACASQLRPAASVLRLRLRGFGFGAWRLQLLPSSISSLALCGFGFDFTASALRLGFAASISHLEFRVLGVFAFSAASASPFRHRGFASVASAFRIVLSECSSFASASWLRLCGLCFATLALRLQFRSFGFAASALRLSLFGPGITDATHFGVVASPLRLQLRLRSFGHMASA